MTMSGHLSLCDFSFVLRTELLVLNEANDSQMKEKVDVLDPQHYYEKFWHYPGVLCRTRGLID